MRLGVVTNLFPPKVFGGYEIGCGEVVGELRERGLNVQVLTSRDCPKDGREYVHNTLSCSIEVGFSKMSRLAKLRFLIRHEHENLREFRKFLINQQPDLLYFWNLSHTSRSMLSLARESGIPFGTFVFDHALCSVATDPWLSQFAKVSGNPARSLQRVLMAAAGMFIQRPGDLPQKFDFIHYPTIYLRQLLQNEGIFSRKWSHVSWGVDTEVFHPGKGAEPGRILFTGQVAEHKGVHVLIAALGKLQVLEPEIPWSLTIVGPLLDVDYINRLDALVGKLGLKGRVVFAGAVSRANLPGLYRNHSIYVFPSIWEEPMGIGILEAMASGLAVVGSGTGGSGELFEDGKSGVLFLNGNDGDLSAKILFLIKNPTHMVRLGANARRRVCEKHGRNEMGILLTQLLC